MPLTITFRATSFEHIQQHEDRSTFADYRVLGVGLDTPGAALHDASPGHPAGAPTTVPLVPGSHPESACFVTTLMTPGSMPSLRTRPRRRNQPASSAKDRAPGFIAKNILISRTCIYKFARQGSSTSFCLSNQPIKSRAVVLCFTGHVMTCEATARCTTTGRMNSKIRS